MRAALAIVPFVLPLLAACGAEPPPDLDPEVPGAPEAPPLLAPEVPAEPPIFAPGDAPEPPVLPDRDALQAKQEEWRAKMNEMGRGLLDSFERRVYDPARDAGLRFAEGLARVQAGDAVGSFRVTFDAERPEEQRVTVVPEGDVEGLPARSEQQVLQLATVALDGPYRTVVRYLPPIDLLLTTSNDRTAKIVTAPPHQNDVQVSYRFDDRELIAIRGISVRPAAEITHYEWTFFRGRYLISRFWVYGTNATCDLEYDDRESSGVVLLRRALLQKEDRAFDVAFTWERVETGP